MRSPLASSRLITSPTSPRLTPSGLTRTRVRSDTAELLRVRRGTASLPRTGHGPGHGVQPLPQDVHQDPEPAEQGAQEEHRRDDQPGSNRSHLSGGSDDPPDPAAPKRGRTDDAEHDQTAE